MLRSSTGSTLTFCSAPDRVGKDGALRLAFERRGGRTVLTERRFTLPLQALEPIPLDGDGSLYLMLLNPTGGLVGGDHLTAEIMLGAGAHVCLTTPSAGRVYRTSGPPAVQETAISLGEGAILEYVPDHLIPHPGSALHQALNVEMGQGSRAIIFDAFAIGRLARGERWAFGEMMNRITVTRQGRPLFLERTRLVPGERVPAGLGGMEGSGYLATLGLFASGFERWEEASHALTERLSGLPSVLGGVSPISHGGLIVRFLAPSAPDLTRASHVLWTLARQLLLNLPPLDLRKW